MKREKEKNTEHVILRVAEKMFMEKGFSQVSTVAIAKEVGCNQALIHYYYRSKKQLLSLVFRNRIEPFLMSLLEMKYENLPFLKRMEKRVRSHFKMIVVNPNFPLILLTDVLSNQELSTMFYQVMKDLPISVLKQFQAELDEAFNEGIIRKTLAVDFAFQMVALNVGVVMLKPVLRLFLNLPEKELDKLIEERGEVNLRTLMRSLEPECKIGRAHV